MPDDLEAPEDTRLYDEAMARKEPSIPADEAFPQLEAKRQKKYMPYPLPIRPKAVKALERSMSLIIPTLKRHLPLGE